jgi:hypothetical protein
MQMHCLTDLASPLRLCIVHATSYLSKVLTGIQISSHMIFPTICGISLPGNAGGISLLPQLLLLLLWMTQKRMVSTVITASLIC